MPNIARRAVALAALAAAIVAGAVALDLPSAVAQSDEETGRIVARRLDDGRTEFGWQPAGAARVLPRARYFPADAQVDRWLNSSPVEVGGAEIGQINARMLADGRIEFGFTPTDGERIEPSARYFPVDARVGRWLRSTEIAISAAPAAGFVAISAGYWHTCAIRAGSGAIECWGWNEYGQTDAPDGSFTTVSAGGEHTCAIRVGSGAIECWGSNEASYWNEETETFSMVRVGQATPPTGSFTAVSAGVEHSCAIRESNSAIECWGENEYGQTDAPDGSFTALSATSRTCAIRDDGTIACWGFDDFTPMPPPPGSFTAISNGHEHSCAIRAESGAIECWGNSWYGATDAPAGSFTAVSAGHSHTCAIRDTGALECWGNNREGETAAPAGRFSAVAAGGGHTCAIRAESGAIECWGEDRYFKTNAPAP